MTFWIFFGMAVIIGVAWYFGNQRQNRLISEGKIIKRQAAFWEYSEFFTLTGISYEKVLEAVNNEYFSDLKVTTYPNNGGRKEILFKSSYEWNAAIDFVEQNGDTYKYRFAFTAWNTYKYNMPPRADTMNMMETKIEKLFLNLDPNTIVESRETKLRTRPI